MTYLASMFANAPFATVFFTLVVALYALVRPRMIRDYEERPLPPNLVARAAVVVVYVMAYLALVWIATVGGHAFFDGAVAILELTPYKYADTFAKNYQFDVRHNAPTFASFLFFAPLSLTPLRELERRLLVWLHRGTHFSQDGQLLAHHLANCAFEPPIEDRKRAIKGLRAFNVFLTDDATSSIKLGSVEHWRKVNALLELLQAWNPAGQSALSKSQQQKLAQYAAAHQRKTGLALGIVSLLAQEDDRGETLSKVSRILDSAPHGDAHDSTRLEGDIARLIGASGGARQGSTRLGSKEFEAYLRPINDYFVVEYQLLLEELSQLAAKCLLNAGDRASSRLDDLKKAGFKGLGLIERMDMPRLLLVLFSVAASGFVTFYLLGFGAGRGGAAGAGQEMPDRNIMMAAISLILAAAALIGAFVGSIGSLTLSPTVPWKRYLQAGMIGVLAFFLIHGAQFTAFGDPISKRQANIAALKSKGPGLALADQAVIRPPSTTKNVNALARIAPFSILPFCIVVGMCLLARLPGYWTPALVARSRFATVAWERSLDGIAMCVVLFAGFASAFFVSSTLGMMPKPDVSTTPGADGPRMLSALLQFGVLGFLIGAIVLRDVRMAAHAQIVTGERPPGRTITQAS